MDGYGNDMLFRIIALLLEDDNTAVMKIDENRHNIIVNICVFRSLVRRK